MPDSPNRKMPETALATRSVEEEARLLEKQRLRTERGQLRRQERADEFKGLVDKVKATAARQVALKRYVFLSDEDLLTKYKLNAQQIAIVRQWEQPKRNAAFAVESSSKLIEAETRASADKPSVVLNVGNMVVLPEKREETVPAVYIDVSPDGDKR